MQRAGSSRSELTSGGHHHHFSPSLQSNHHLVFNATNQTLDTDFSQLLAKSLIWSSYRETPIQFDCARFNEDCQFSNCNYREHQTHFHCMRKDCNYRFCDKTRFVQVGRQVKDQVWLWLLHRGISNHGTIQCLSIPNATIKHQTVSP